MSDIDNFSVCSVLSVAKICVYQRKKLLNCEANPADFYALGFSVKNYQIFFDNMSVGRIISAVGFVIGCNDDS